MHRKSLEAAEALKNEDSGASDREDTASKASDISSTGPPKMLMPLGSSGSSIPSTVGPTDSMGVCRGAATPTSSPASSINCTVNVTSPNSSIAMTTTPTTLSPASPSHHQQHQHHLQQLQHLQQQQSHQLPPQPPPPPSSQQMQHQHPGSPQHQQQSPSLSQPPPLPSQQSHQSSHHLSSLDQKSKEMNLVTSPHHPSYHPENDPEAFRWVDYNRDPISFIRWLMFSII